jgi:hypothetical protein
MSIVPLKDFLKDPVKSFLFLSLTAIMYLYFDNKAVYTEQIRKQEIRIEKLERNVDDLQIKLLRKENQNLI